MYEWQGIALCIASMGFLYLFYQLGRFYKSMADIEERYGLFEIAVLNIKAHSKGINLDKEKSKLRTYRMLESKRSFRNTLKKEIIDELFSDDKAIEKQNIMKEKK